ncbi:MAG TPA: hypothetical protein VF587_08070 [Solirubrobacteraceae bacterium]|jgi:hypothetical protein
MSHFHLHHRHEPADCEAAFAAWNGFDSPLRHQPADSTCLTGEHTVYWRVRAESAAAALSLVPPFLRARTVAIAVRDVVIP